MKFDNYEPTPVIGRIPSPPLGPLNRPFHIRITGRRPCSYRHRQPRGHSISRSTSIRVMQHFNVRRNRHRRRRNPVTTPRTRHACSQRLKDRKFPALQPLLLDAVAVAIWTATRAPSVVRKGIGNDRVRFATRTLSTLKPTLGEYYLLLVIQSLT